MKTKQAILAVACLLATAANAVTLTGVESCKIHGSAGLFCLPIVSGTVEPRALGSGHVIVFEFDGAVDTVPGASAVDSFGTPVPITQVLIQDNFVGVYVQAADKSRMTVSIQSAGVLSFAASASLGFLFGDLDQSGTVDAVDILIVRSQSLQPVVTANYLADVNANGIISAADIAAVRARSGQSLP